MLQFSSKVSCSQDLVSGSGKQGHASDIKRPAEKNAISKTAFGPGLFDR